MSARRPELGSRPYRRNRANMLADDDTCHWCGHPGADAADHLDSPLDGGDPVSPDNLAPIHGVDGCPTCGRRCNSERGRGGTAPLVTSRDWYAGPA